MLLGRITGNSYFAYGDGQINHYVFAFWSKIVPLYFTGIAKCEVVV